MPQPISRRPFQELNLCNGLGPQPSCRMSDYAEAMLRAWIIVAFRSDSFGIILDVPHLIGWSAELYFDSACINSARAVNASLRALLST
jgi:hypothetical protein